VTGPGEPADQPEQPQPPEPPTTIPQPPQPPPDTGAPPPLPPLFPPLPGQTAYSFYASLYAGSLPPHDFAQEWAKLVPNAPERLFKMTEDEAVHRRWMDRSFVYYRFLAQIGTLLLAVLALGGGIYLIASGKKAYGLAAIIGEFALLALVLLVRQFRGNGGSDRNNDNGPQLPAIRPDAP
jgi:uncharacterized membrane protein